MNIKLPPAEIRAYQDPYELEQLLALFQYYAPKRILEIGSASGGTTWCWAHNAIPGAEITAVSLFDSADYVDPRPLFPVWEKECQVTIRPINGDSHSPEIVESVGAFAPFDWIFIDGDHHIDSARADYRNYTNLAAAPAIAVLHDIAWIPELTHDLEVRPLWDELQAKFATTRIVSAPNQIGVGLVFLNR
jgi:predicted O-methyltransferase YrrM